MTARDIGDRCVFCGEDTSAGSGRWANRIPADCDTESTAKDGTVIFADGDHRDGWACAECMAWECDRCDQKIGCDEDISASDVFGEEKDEFDDGSWKVCEDCLTDSERAKWEAAE